MTESNLERVGSCAGCVSRRTFVAQSTLAAAAAAFLAACGDGQIGDGLTDPGGSKQIKVSDFPDLATMDKFVVVDGTRAVKRLTASTFMALSLSCTHEGTIVDFATGGGFVCPNHGSRFDSNGRVTVSPATRDLTKLATAYDAATDILTIG